MTIPTSLLSTIVVAGNLGLVAGCASNQLAQCNAPDGFYVGSDTATNYSVAGGSGATFFIHEDDAFFPRNIIVSPTGQIPGGYLIQISGQGTEKMLDLSGIVIIVNHRAYFGNAKRVGSAAIVSLLLDNREEAEVVSSILQKRYSLLKSLSSPLGTNTPSKMNVPEFTDQSGSSENDRAALRAALDYAAKQREDRIRGVPLPPSQFPFPNYDAGPLRPLPSYLNFYTMNDRYPDYLLCQYDVDVRNYNQSSEPKWLRASLKQIRQLGRKKFPPIKWIAVIIVNRAEWNGASTFEQAHKVGTIFEAGDVFNSPTNLSQLIAHANMDRHPFKYDTSQPTPGDQQRWIIVEQHAATNQTK